MLHYRATVGLESIMCNVFLQQQTRVTILDLHAKSVLHISDDGTEEQNELSDPAAGKGRSCTAPHKHVKKCQPWFSECFSVFHTLSTLGLLTFRCTFQLTGSSTSLQFPLLPTR